MNEIPHFVAPDYRVPHPGEAGGRDPGAGSDDTDGAVQVAASVAAGAAEPRADVEPRRHRAHRDLRLRPGVAARRSRRGDDAGAGARSHRLREAAAGERRLDEEVPHDSAARGAVQHKARTSEHARVSCRRGLNAPN